MKPLISNIQRFSLHDGPGIRTTVFFKGCSLQCPWCANPENIHFEREWFFIKEKCSKNCKNIECRKIPYPMVCDYGAIGSWGDYYTEEKLYDIIMKDYPFYQNEGGVTFSGGEPLLFLDRNYGDLCNRLRNNGISICIETAFFVDKRSIEWAIKNVDYFYIDLKILEEKKCKELIKGDLSRFIENIEYFFKNRDNKNVIYRIPMVDGYTGEFSNVLKLVDFIRKYPVKKVEILCVHNLAEKKYQRLGYKYNNFIPPETSTFVYLEEEIRKLGINVEVKGV